MALQAMALKAKKSKDPDIPSTREALSGPYAEDFSHAGRPFSFRLYASQPVMRMHSYEVR
jgi:hypothetical protein